MRGLTRGSRNEGGVEKLSSVGYQPNGEIEGDAIKTGSIAKKGTEKGVTGALPPTLANYRGRPPSSWFGEKKRFNKTSKVKKNWWGGMSTRPRGKSRDQIEPPCRHKGQRMSPHMATSQQGAKGEIQKKGD